MLEFFCWTSIKFLTLIRLIWLIQAMQIEAYPRLLISIPHHHQFIIIIRLDGWLPTATLKITKIFAYSNSFMSTKAAM